MGLLSGQKEEDEEMTSGIASSIFPYAPQRIWSRRWCFLRVLPFLHCFTVKSFEGTVSFRKGQSSLLEGLVGFAQKPHQKAHHRVRQSAN